MFHHHSPWAWGFLSNVCLLHGGVFVCWCFMLSFLHNRNMFMLNSIPPLLPSLATIRFPSLFSRSIFVCKCASQQQQPYSRSLYVCVRACLSIIVAPFQQYAHSSPLPLCVWACFLVVVPSTTVFFFPSPYLCKCACWTTWCLPNNNNKKLRTNNQKASCKVFVMQ